MTERALLHPSARLPLHATPVLLALALVVAWDVSGLDLWLAALGSNASGFPARDHWLLTKVMHDGARILSGVLLALLALSVARPFGALKCLSRRKRVWLAVTVVSAMLLISVIKHFTQTSCPWDLEPFGGATRYVPHWLLGRNDGGSGHCFPAGHASAGFAWVAVWFAFEGDASRARRWLSAALVAGLLLGIAQQLRGAHFMSHTLWTGWLCWAWAWLLSPLARERHDAAAAG